MTNYLFSDSQTWLSENWFVGLPEETLLELSRLEQIISIEAGEVLFEKGDESDAVYQVIHGRLGVYRKENEGEFLLVESEPTQVIGGEGVLNQTPRSATIRAIRDTQLRRLSASDLMHLLENHPSFTIALTRFLSQRIQALTAQVKTTNLCRAFSLFPITPGLALSEFARQLSGAMPGNVAILDLPRMKAELSGGSREASIQSGETSAWLNTHEENGPTLILGDPAFEDWCEVCLRQSDQILLVADSTREPDLSWFETSYRERLRQLSSKIRLVLIHPHGTQRATGTSQWLHTRPYALRHHHVAWDSVQDLERLGRFMRRTSTGVVFSGGGARSAGQLGALQAFDEMDFPIDAVGGTSAGAVIAATRAAGLGVEQTIKRLLQHVQGGNPLGSLTVPMVSLFEGRRLEERLASFLGDALIEDLWLPYFCVSTNLTQMKPQVYWRGSLYRAVLASISLPGLVPPVLDQGEVFVDGGLIDNLPVGTMRKLGLGKIVALDASELSGLQAEPGLERCPGGWRQLVRRLLKRPSYKEVPSLVEMLLQLPKCSILLQQKHPSSEADLVLKIPSVDLTMLSFERFSDAIEPAKESVASRRSELLSLLAN